jgi:hypothetical protein
MGKTAKVTCRRPFGAFYGVKRAMEISKNLDWITDYLDSVSHLVNFGLIDEIRGIRSFPLSRIQPAEGLTYFLPNKRFEVVIYLQYQKKVKPFEKKFCEIEKAPFSSLDILQILAHELAHTCTTFDHTPEHKMMECKIMVIFMKKLIKNGYVSEELELAS